MSTSHNRIRLALDIANPLASAVNVFTGESPRMPKARACQVEIAFFDNGVLMDVADITAVNLEVKTTTANVVDVGSAPIVNPAALAAIDINTGLTQADWEGGLATKYHCRFQLTASQTSALTVGSDNTKLYGLIITGTTSAGRVTFGIAALTAVDDGGITTSTAPAAGDPVYFTAAEVLAMLQGFLTPTLPAGVAITVVSTDGVWGRRLSVGTDGTLQTDLIKLA